MASAKFDTTFRSVLQHNNAFFLLTGPLENEIVPLWSIKADKFLVEDISFICFHLNEARKFSFADLALKFGEVVMLGASNNLLLDLDSDPLSQTIIVNGSAAAVAETRVEEEITVLFSLI